MEEQLQEEVTVRTKVPTLDDVMSEEELAQVTAEGLAANPEQTPEQVTEAMQRAAQQEAYLNFQKQQYFMRFLSQRPYPTTFRQVDWALVRYELIIAEKKEFDNDLSIARLNEHQWYHGITTGNLRVTRNDEGTVFVNLVVPYDRFTTNLAYTPEQLEERRIREQARLPRKQRRQLH
ncbi:hypothetical protein [Burkholderia phage FLC9]|nr:hypothetical protein [Burkholderia phage FLC9]